MPVPALVVELFVILSRLPPLVKEILAAAGVELAFRGADALAAELGKSDAIVSALLEPGPETQAAIDGLLKLLDRPDVKRSFDQEQAAPLIDATESLEGRFGNLEKVREQLRQNERDLHKQLEIRADQAIDPGHPIRGSDQFELRIAELEEAISLAKETIEFLEAGDGSGPIDTTPDIGESAASALTPLDESLAQRLDDASLTFDALVQVFGEAVARIDESSERFKAAIDGLIGPGGEMEGEIEPGFRRAALGPGGGSAGAAVMPVNGEFARASAAMTGFVAETQESLGVLGDLFEETFGAFERELIDALETGKVEWQDFARVAIDAIDDILAEQAKLLFAGEGAPGGGAGGILGDLLGAVFSGFFAHGGRPPVGMAALVGEAGPELFVPDAAGTILPNDLLGSVGGETVVTITLNAPIDARGAEHGVERRIAEAMAQAEYRISQNVMAHILNNARRGGAFARMSRR